jgi:hypothetical protein
MVVVFPVPSSEKVTYSFSTQGVHISNDTSSWLLYLGIGLIILFSVGWSFPSVNTWIVLAIAILGSILITKFAILPLKYVQTLLHRKKTIHWDNVKSSELKGLNIKFVYVKNGSYQEEISFALRKEKVEVITQFLSEVLKDRFVVKN